MRGERTAVLRAHHGCSRFPFVFHLPRRSVSLYDLSHTRTHTHRQTHTHTHTPTHTLFAWSLMSPKLPHGVGSYGNETGHQGSWLSVFNSSTTSLLHFSSQLPNSDSCQHKDCHKLAFFFHLLTHARACHVLFCNITSKRQSEFLSVWARWGKPLEQTL